MNSDQAQEISERDQLWASLRALRAEIERLAADAAPLSDTKKQVAELLARIVLAEMDFRDRESGAAK
jgi:hypothetical protein